LKGPDGADDIKRGGHTESGHFAAMFRKRLEINGGRFRHDFQDCPMRMFLDFSYSFTLLGNIASK
jgi:hypothetical protein